MKLILREKVSDDHFSNRDLWTVCKGVFIKTNDCFSRLGCSKYNHTD